MTTDPGGTPNGPATVRSISRAAGVTTAPRSIPSPMRCRPATKICTLSPPAIALHAIVSVATVMRTEAILGIPICRKMRTPSARQ